MRAGHKILNRPLTKVFLVQMLVDKKTELKCLVKSSDAPTLLILKTPLRLTVDGRLLPLLFLPTKSKKHF